VRPNGQGIDDVARIGYKLGSRANVTILLAAPDGQSYTLRNEVLRAADSYEIKFTGAVPISDTGDQRVLPDGSYKMSIRATDLQGHSEEQQVQVRIQDADTVPLEITNVVVSYINTFWKRLQCLMELRNY
jgi:hypothetical protein